VTVEQFLFHEARLLDTQQYEAWLELFTDDATYWVPLEAGQKDPHETSSIIHDDKTLLELRIKQARHPRAHARLPLARTVHQVGERGRVVAGIEPGPGRAPRIRHQNAERDKDNPRRYGCQAAREQRDEKIESHLDGNGPSPWHDGIDGFGMEAVQE